MPHETAFVLGGGGVLGAGEVIAYVGTTGNAQTTPPHVHFEANPGGGPAHDPAPWLSAICAG